MSFKEFMILKIGKQNYIDHFPSHYSEIEIIQFVEEWHKQKVIRIVADFSMKFNTEFMDFCNTIEEAIAETKDKIDFNV